MPKIEVVKKDKLVIVHGLTVNYDQLPRNAVAGLPKNNSLIANRFPLKKWNGGKSGTAEIDIHLVKAGRYLSTADARLFVAERQLQQTIPAEIVPLKKYCQELWDKNVHYAVALCDSDEALWQDPAGDLRVIYLGFNPNFRGFYLYDADDDQDDGWNDLASFAGLPQ